MTVKSKRMLRAADVMSSPVKSVELGTTLEQVAARLSDEGVTGLLVVSSGGKPVGVVTHADIVGYVAGLERELSGPGAFYFLGEVREDLASPGAPANLDQPGEDALRTAEVDAVMTPEVIWVPDGMKLPDVARVMVEKKIHRVLVERGGHVVGIISTLDLLKAFASPSRAPAKRQRRRSPARA